MTEAASGVSPAGTSPPGHALHINPKRRSPQVSRVLQSGFLLVALMALRATGAESSLAPKSYFYTASGGLSVGYHLDDITTYGAEGLLGFRATLIEGAWFPIPRLGIGACLLDATVFLSTGIPPNFTDERLLRMVHVAPLAPTVRVWLWTTKRAAHFMSLQASPYGSLLTAIPGYESVADYNLDSYSVAYSMVYAKQPRTPVEVEMRFGATQEAYGYERGDQSYFLACQLRAAVGRWRSQ